MMIFGIILGVIVSINIVGFIVNTIFFKDELKSIEPYGQMVEVDGKKMHVFSMGSSKSTIVLLPDRKSVV